MSCNGKTIVILFCNVFYYCIEGKSSICFLLAMSTCDDWMVDMMIIYIKKIVTKVVDSNDIILILWGCHLHESKSLK